MDTNMNTSNKPHKHWRLIRDYAQDAAETEKPWERWQWKHAENETWYNPKIALAFIEEYDYRRKPRVIIINGIEVPEPMRDKPEEKSLYWVPDICNLTSLATQIIWKNDVHDNEWLSLRICHSTRESAELHAKALLSFTKKEETK